MTAYPLHEVETDLYARIASHAAGAGVRALATVIPATALAVPITPPLVVWRQGPLTQIGEMTLLTCAWWCYTAYADAYTQTRILTLIAEAYPPDALAFGRMRLQGLSQPTSDASLGGAWGRSLTITYLRRGAIYV